MTEIAIENRKPNREKLLRFGFSASGGAFRYTARLAGGSMELRLCLEDDRLFSEVVDLSGGEEYILHLVPGATGAFVGQIKAEYEEILDVILRTCFDSDSFHASQTGNLLRYASEVYGDALEFLWKNSENAILRRKDSRKWYAALLKIPAEKIGLPGSETIEIIDLRIRPEEVAGLIDHQRYFPGYHMNKSHWVTMRLDGSIPEEELLRRLDESYQLAKK